jgi:hypothetical protein
LRICSHSRHIPIVQGETKNNKYLVYHKGANKAFLCAKLQTLKYTFQPFFCLNLFFKKFLQMDNFLNIFGSKNWPYFLVF